MKDSTSIAYQAWLSENNLEASPEMFRRFHETPTCPQHNPCNFCHA